MIYLNRVQVKFGQFPNKERNLNFNTISFSNTSMITLKYESDQDLMDLYILKSYIDQVIPRNSVSLNILYMPYSRMDRANEFYTFNLKYVCNFINSMNFSIVYLMDAHSDVTPALLDRCVNRSIVPTLYKNYIDIVGNQDHAVVFPDATAEKRYSKFFQGIKTVTASKERDFVDGKISKYKIDTAGLEGKNILLVDDLVSKGGTFEAAAKILRTANVNRIDLIVAHCEENIMNGNIPHSPEGENVDKVFTTNSIITDEFFKLYNSVYNWLKTKINIHDLINEKERYV